MININDYDVGQIMQEMEIELIKSMKRNLGRHEDWEKDEGFKWEQWQAKKIREIRKYRNQNNAIMSSYSGKLDSLVKTMLRSQFLEGGRKVDNEVSKVIKKGFSLTRCTPSDDFFQGDYEKLNKLINAIRNDLKQAQYAALRQMDDVYRKTIFKTNLFLGSGSTTLDKAIDMATKSFLSAGINCITYKDGKNVNIASYTRMAVRTANKRVFLMGEGERRNEWGLSLVLVSQYMQCSPLCLPWQGKVYIDDVYSGGKTEDGDYQLLSVAIEGNLFHPNCRHTMSTYFEGISSIPEPMNKEEMDNAYEAVQRENEINRNIQRYKRLKEGSLDQNNIAKYDSKLNEWKNKLSKFYSGDGLGLKKQRRLYEDNVLYEKYKKILGTDLTDSVDEFQNLKYTDIEKWNGIKKRYSEAFSTKDYNELVPDFIKNTSNLKTRQWYKWHDENIPNIIDKTVSIEQQARQAHELRNMYRIQARELMRDQEARRQLDINHPNPTFEQLVERKRLKYGLTDEQAYQDILRSSSVTNKKYDKIAGIEEE